MVILRQEFASDGEAIEQLLDLCFGPDRLRKASYQFRKGVPCIDQLALVAVDDHDDIVGTIRYWPVSLGESGALLLGPIAVHPSLHGRGVGRALVFTSLSNTDELGFDTVFFGRRPDLLWALRFRHRACSYHHAKRKTRAPPIPPYGRSRTSLGTDGFAPAAEGGGASIVIGQPKAGIAGTAVGCAA